MSALPTTILPRLGSLVRMLSSPNDGEALSAVRAVGRTLQANGTTWHDLAERIEHEPPPKVIYREVEERCPDVAPNWSNSSRLIIRTKLERAIHGGALKGWEAEFAASIAGEIAASRSWHPTPKQEARLDALIGKLHAKGAWA